MRLSRAEIVATQRENLRLVNRERFTRSFYRFAVWAFGVLFPAEAFIDGWHIKVICDHLQAVAERRINKLIIAIPPGHMKSLLCSVFWPVWLWIRNPGEQVLSASYAASLSTRDSARSRRIIESPDFQEIFGDLRLRDDQNAKNRYENEAGGYRLATSVGGTVTGEGGTACIGDDLHKADEATSDLVRGSTIDWFCEAWSSRLRGRSPVEVLIGQRVHERDVSGFCLHDRTGYQYLCLPAVCEADRRCSTTTDDGEHFFTDDRPDGAPLWPEMFPIERLLDFKVNEYVWNGQYRQTPTTKGGNIVKETWFQVWKKLPEQDTEHADEPHGFGFIFSSWDCKFKKTTGGAFVVGQLWAVRWPHYYLIDQKRGRWGFTETLQAIRDADAEWRALGLECYAHVVEEAANGAAIVEVLTNEIPGMTPRRVEGGDKIARLVAETPTIASGCVFIPDVEQHPWVRDFIAEVKSFPASATMDQVDAMSQALSFARKAYASVVSTSEEKKEDQERPVRVDEDDEEREALYQ